MRRLAARCSYALPQADDARRACGERRRSRCAPPSACAEAAVAQEDWARGSDPPLVALFTARRGFPAREDLPWAQEHRQRFEEVRACALEYAAVALGVGGSELAPGERVARELISAAPYRERGHELLMQIHGDHRLSAHQA